MVLGGDELGRTQHGNNNAYCQDNDVSWFDWAGAEVDDDLLAFTRRLLSLRTEHTSFRRRDWLQGGSTRDGSAVDIVWFTPAGAEMSADERAREPAGAMSTFLNGRDIPTSDRRGTRASDDDFMILFNALDQEVDFTLPPDKREAPWTVLVDTSDPAMQGASIATGNVGVGGRSLVLLQLSRGAA